MARVIAVHKRTAHFSVKIFVGENDVEDMQLAILNPNTRTLIRVNMGDYENDMAVFQMLRGGSSYDMALRRSELSRFEVTPDMIDT